MSEAFEEVDLSVLKDLNLDDFVEDGPSFDDFEPEEDGKDLDVELDFEPCGEPDDLGGE